MTFEQPIFNIFLLLALIINKIQESCISKAFFFYAVFTFLKNIYLKTLAQSLVNKPFAIWILMNYKENFFYFGLKYLWNLLGLLILFLTERTLYLKRAYSRDGPVLRSKLKLSLKDSLLRKKEFSMFPVWSFWRLSWSQNTNWLSLKV